MVNGKQLAIGSGNDIGRNTAVPQNGHFPHAFPFTEHGNGLDIGFLQLNAQIPGKDYVDHTIGLTGNQQYFA